MAAVEEALAIRRVLAAARPDAFLPDLATSYGTRGRILAGQDPANAAASFAEGIAALRAPFLALPAGFGPLTVTLGREYLAACNAAGTEPDMELLAPIVGALRMLAHGRRAIERGAMTMDTDELAKVAAAAAVGALTKAAAEPALAAGRRVWDWLKQKLGGKDQATVAEVEADPSKRSAPARVTAMLQDLLDADTALAEELRRLLNEGAGVQAITQTANVQGETNTTMQTAGSGNTVTTGR